MAIEKQSIAGYQVIFGEDATPAEMNAANVLAQYLNEITGLDYTARQGVPPGAKEILVGQISGENVSALGEEGFLIKAEGETIIITGGRPRGTLYGVFHFLELYFNCRWYTRELHVIPQGPAEIAPVKTEQYIPPLEYRQTEWLTRDSGVFAAANRLNDNVARKLPEEWGGSIGYAGPFCHTIPTHFVSRNQFFDTNPEWFSWRDGIEGRMPGQLCLTNPEVLEQILLEVRETCLEGVERFGGKRFIVSITQDDNQDFCQCPECRAVDEEEGSHAGTMLRFVNAIAEASEDEFPQALFDTFAYQYTRTPPNYVRPRDNVVVRLCSIECCFAHPLNDPDCPDNLRFSNDIKTWSEMSRQLYIWDYTNIYSHYHAPFSNFFVLQPNIQFFVEHKVQGLYEQGNHQSERAHSAFNQLKGYLIARLMYDPYLDFDAEMNGFLKAYYGGGWQYVREFIDLTVANAGKPGSGGNHRKMSIFDSPTGKGLLDLKPNQVKYADLLWEKAIALAGDEQSEEHVRRSQLHWRYWKAANSVEEFSRWQWPGTWQRANEQLFNDLEAFGIELYHETWAHDEGLLKRPGNWRGLPQDDWH